MRSAASARREGPIVVDLQAVQSPTTRGRGIGRYALSWALALEAHDPDLVGSYLLNPRLAPPGDLGALAESGKIAFAGSDRAIGPRARALHVLSPLDLELGLSELWSSSPATAGLLRSATLYDLIPALLPEAAPANAGERRLYRLRIEALRGVDGLQSLSQAVARQAIEVLGIDSTKVHHVGAAADARFVAPRSQLAAREQVGRALAAFGLTDRYIFAPSGSHPRKNNELLVAAFANLPRALRSDLQLVIQGELDEPTRHHYAVLAESLGAAGRIVTPGHVDDDLLVRLYQGAELVCVASLAEGFGLPIAEAFACRAAVVCSDRPPFDELVRREGRFDPTRVEAVSRALLAALDDGQHRELLRVPAAGLDDWSDVARRAATSLRELLDRSNRRRQRPLRRKRPRLAFVSPLPPAASGVAGYSYRLLRALLDTEKLDIDVYRDGPTHDQVAPAGLDVKSVDALVDVEALLGRYDHVVYALGNSHHHEGALRALRRRPGTVLAHDVRLSNLYRAENGDPGLAKGGLERALRHQYGDVLPSGLGRDGELSRADIDRFGLLMAREAVACAQRFLVNSSVAAALASADVGPRLAARVALLPFAVERPGNGEFAEDPRLFPEGIDRSLGRQWGLAATPAAANDVIAHFGIVDPVKLPELTIEAFALLAAERPDVELVFVGPIADELLRVLSTMIIAAGLEGRIGFTGPLSANAYASWFERAKLAVQLRAASNGEASAAVGECLASGLPTVVARVGWTGELPDGAVEKLDIPCSASALAGTLGLLLLERERRRALSHEAAHYAEQHGFDHTARALLFALDRPVRD